MLESNSKYSPKLKPYHIIFLSIALVPFLIINSNSVNKKREEEAQLNEDHQFLEKLYLRKLDFESDVNQICQKGSKKLKEYYTTGDPETIGIDDDKKVESGDNPDYIEALINIVAGNGDSVEEEAKKYVMHLMPVIAFFVIAFLSLPIWFIFCICCCSNCCCCCCCKKNFCKIPFFIVTMVFYAIVLVISIYGLSQSNSVFVGLADTECSILKFIGEVLDGESKETKPKWAGISEIRQIFQKTIDKISTLTAKDILQENKGKASTAKDNFENALQRHSQNIKTPDSYNQPIGEYNYYLDIIYNFGEFTKGTPSSAEPTGSFVWRWYQEFKTISENSETQMQTAYTNYEELQGNSDIENTLNQGISSISDIEVSFNDVKEQVSGMIISYSDKMDEYGKLAFKIIFSVFMVLDLAIAGFMCLLLFCSFKFCKNCCCFRCLFKSCLHILWNILAFLTFFVLLLGSIFTLIGTVGKDLISVVSFLVSDKNLNQDEPILLGEAKNYLLKCINGNGDISSELHIQTDEMNNIDDLRTAANEINQIAVSMESLKNNQPTYNSYLNDYEDRANYRIDNFDLIKLDGSSKLNLRTYLNDLNSNIPNTNNHEWSISCSNPHSCDTVDNSNTAHLCINPNTCSANNLLNWYSDAGGDSNVKVVNAFINSIKIARENGINIDETNESAKTDTITSQNIGTILKDLKIKYDHFIQTQIDSLSIFSNNINQLAELFNEFAGEGSDSSVYSIINCKFIGRNVRIILKNLKESLGQSFYSVGVCLVISGISMLISIAFTILLNSIISSTIGNKTEK